MIGSLELLASLRVEGGRWGETADFQLRNAKRVLTLGGRCTFITLCRGGRKTANGGSDAWPSS